MIYNDEWVFEPICESGKDGSDIPAIPRESEALAFALSNLEKVLSNHGEIKYAAYRRGLLRFTTNIRHRVPATADYGSRVDYTQP